MILTVPYVILLVFLCNIEDLESLVARTVGFSGRVHASFIRDQRYFTNQISGLNTGQVLFGVLLGHSSCCVAIHVHVSWKLEETNFIAHGFATFGTEWHTELFFFKSFFYELLSKSF